MTSVRSMVDPQLIIIPQKIRNERLLTRPKAIVEHASIMKIKTVFPCSQ